MFRLVVGREGSTSSFFFKRLTRRMITVTKKKKKQCFKVQWHTLVFDMLQDIKLF